MSEASTSASSVDDDDDDDDETSSFSSSFLTSDLSSLSDTISEHRALLGNSTTSLIGATCLDGEDCDEDALARRRSRIALARQRRAAALGTKQAKKKKCWPMTIKCRPVYLFAFILFSLSASRVLVPALLHQIELAYRK